MANSKVDDLLAQLAAVQSEIDQHAAAVRDLNEQVAGGAGLEGLPEEELSELLAKGVRHSQGMMACARRAAAIYEELRGHGVATPELDEWHKRVCEQFGTSE